MVAKLDSFLAIRPLTGNVECGDTGIIKEFGDKVFMAVVDVLGHGESAHRVAKTCKEFLQTHYRGGLVEIMHGLDQHIKGSQGAVAGLCHLDLKTGEVKYVGTGNITARKFGSCAVRMVSRSGIIGYVMPTPREEKMALHDGDAMLLYTDGVKKHFELADYPELLKDDAKTIATHVIHQFGKEDDDAACIASRYEK